MDTSNHSHDWSAQLRAAFDAAPVGMALLDLDGTVMQANRALRAMLGLAAVWPAGAKLRDFLHPDDAASADIQYWLLATGDLDSYRAEKRLLRLDGTMLWALISAAVVCDGHGYPRFMTVHIQNVTEQKEIEGRLRYRALHDSLTGLPNRAQFADLLDEALAAARRRDEPISVLLLDLDEFKAVNDNLGHSAGDEVLVAVGNRLTHCLREGDTPARVGGDEFAVLIGRSGGPAAAGAVAERVLATFRSPISLAQHAVTISASIGIAHSTSEPITSAELLRHADLALYEAKATGRARYAVFDCGDRDPPAPDTVDRDFRPTRTPTPIRGVRLAGS